MISGNVSDYSTLGLMATRSERAKTVDVHVFYFDVANVVAQFLREPQATLGRLRAFQRAARREFPFGYEHSYVATLYDNVWCRVNAAQPGLPSLLLNYAGTVMRLAEKEGFSTFFGCITRGEHEYDPEDRILIGGTSFEDLKEQHLDITSEPHIRAAYAEKWRATAPAPTNSVWVSAEVLDGSTLAAEAIYPDATFAPAGATFDLSDVGEREWPFANSKFHAIRPV